MALELTADQKKSLRNAKILLFDLEVSPMLAWTYNYYDGQVLKIKEHQKLLCFSYKWLGDDGKPQSVTLLQGSCDPNDDRWITRQLWYLLDEAKMAIAHNGARFDGKMANTFFVEHGMEPPSPYKMMDTLTFAKQKFRFPSNKLDELGKYLDIGQKTEITCGQLWEDCLKGDIDAYEKMAIYCENDVALMEELYWKIAPFSKMPMLNKILKEELICPVCGGKEFKKEGITPDATQTPSWNYRCRCCKHIMKVPLSKEEREEENYYKPMNRPIAGCF